MKCKKANKYLHRHATNALLSHQHSSKSPRSDNENVLAKLAKKKKSLKTGCGCHHSSHGLLKSALAFVPSFSFRLK